MATETTQTVYEYELDQKDPNRGLWVIVGLIGLIIAAFVFLRTTPSPISNGDELAALLTDGHPTVLEFYSNF